MFTLMTVSATVLQNFAAWGQIVSYHNTLEEAEAAARVLHEAILSDEEGIYSNDDTVYIAYP